MWHVWTFFQLSNSLFFFFVDCLFHQTCDWKNLLIEAFPHPVKNRDHLISSLFWSKSSGDLKSGDMVCAHFGVYKDTGFDLNQQSPLFWLYPTIFLMVFILYLSLMPYARPHLIMDLSHPWFTAPFQPLLGFAAQHIILSSSGGTGPQSLADKLNFLVSYSYISVLSVSF